MFRDTKRVSGAGSSRQETKEQLLARSQAQRIQRTNAILHGKTVVILQRVVRRYLSNRHLLSRLRSDFDTTFQQYQSLNTTKNKIASPSAGVEIQAVFTKLTQYLSCIYKFQSLPIKLKKKSKTRLQIAKVQKKERTGDDTRLLKFCAILVSSTKQTNEMKNFFWLAGEPDWTRRAISIARICLNTLGRLAGEEGLIALYLLHVYSFYLIYK